MLPIFSEEQRARYAGVAELVRAELGSRVREHDREASFPREDWDRLGAEGVLGSHVPERYGGQGLGAVDTVLTFDAVGYGCRDNGLTLALGGQTWSVQEPIVIYGSEEQKQKYLPRLCSGEWIGCHGVSEESSGSDALALHTTATRTEGGYLLNGRKCYIGMAPLADLALVLACTDPEAGKWGVSAFLVETASPGFTRSEARAKTGTRTNPLGDLVLEDCFVPEENLLGGEGIGVSLFTQTISWERGFIHAGHLGAMQALLERCVDYAKERRQFGQPIGNFQSVSHRVAEMRTRLETSRLLMYEAAQLKDADRDASMECAMANLHIAESLLECATHAVRIHGARGYLEEFGVERQLRDSVGGVIYAGTSDIQRNLIASLLGL
jgi:alkylation response protein AidB-like acyl-CoA dehydrogenase